MSPAGRPSGLKCAAPQGRSIGQVLRAESGAALIVVVGATAALAVPVALLLLGAGFAYEIERYLAEGRQARWLAEGVRLQVEAAAGRGELAVPRPGSPLTVRNGVVEGSGRTVAVARFPEPPEGADWPSITDRPPDGDAPTFGLGGEATLAAVFGPRGEARDLAGPSAGAPAPVLVDLEVRTWFRRAVATARWRYLWGDAGLRRLD